MFNIDCLRLSTTKLKDYVHTTHDGIIDDFMSKKIEMTRSTMELFTRIKNPFIVKVGNTFRTMKADSIINSGRTLDGRNGVLVKEVVNGTGPISENSEFLFNFIGKNSKLELVTLLMFDNMNSSTGELFIDHSEDTLEIELGEKLYKVKLDQIDNMDKCASSFIALALSERTLFLKRELVKTDYLEELDFYSVRNSDSWIQVETHSEITDDDFIGEMIEKVYGKEPEFKFGVARTKGFEF